MNIDWSESVSAELSSCSAINAARPRHRLVISRRALATFALWAHISLGCTGAEAAVFTVINANPTGPGSLGQAIEDANALAGRDEIVFAIPGSGVHKIDLSRQPLPGVLDDVLIDAYTQPGARANTLAVGSDAVILIQLDGGGPSSSTVEGLALSGKEIVVRGLSLTGFSLSDDPARPGAAILNAIDVESPGGRPRIEGNFIGLSPDGVVSGSYIGVRSGPGDVIGGTTPDKRNVIAGNRIGISALGQGLIAGNYIGVDPSGLRQGYGNHCGIAAHFERVVGGLSPGAGNVISNNEIGIELDSEVTIQGNLIGPRADGSRGFGNQIGIQCKFFANLIGGLAPAEGNVVAFNQKGVVVYRDPTPPVFPNTKPRGNRILSNLFYANSVFDIDLADDELTLNDFQDRDDGENRLQNYPVISEVVRSAGSTTVRGGLNSNPATTFTLQFFANGASRTAPQTLLGTETVTTNSVGDAPFAFTFPVATSSDQFITATATDSRGNTSEFFPARAKVDLGNISARGFVGAGEQVLIGGFMRGSGDNRSLLIRALGPSLNVSGALANPQLVVRNISGGIVAQNDNWKSSQEREIRDTGLAPANDLEAAVLTPLFVTGAPNFGNDSQFTIQVTGADGGTGIGTVEVYALGFSKEFVRELRNVSTRGHVGGGDNVLIGGIILQGSAAPKILVRAIGPELAEAGVSAPLQDPTLELRDGEGNLLVANDDWRSDQGQEIIATGVAPKDDRSAAIVARLLPTMYTAIVRGKDNSTGIALVEFYKLD